MTTSGLDGAAPPTVSQLFVYPVKSLAGIPLELAEAGLRGIAFDRRFMLLDGDGTFLTQRQAPQMALVQPELCGDALVLRHRRLALPPLELPLVPPVASPGAVRRVRVWDDECEAVPVSADADRWLREALGVDCSLVAFPRRGDEEGGRFAAGPLGPHRARAAFADGFPYLVIGQGSLDELNARIGGASAPLAVQRFRPNLVVTGTPAFAEDGWTRFAAGAVRFHVVKPCGRCAIPTVDPDRGTFGKEPLRTLARYRRARDGSVHFGQNAVAETTGVLRIGDPVHVLERAAVAEFIGEGAQYGRARAASIVD